MNNLRITGLASGIDTEEMIRSLMEAERVKVDRVEQDRQILLWRQEMYNNINKDFANFILNSRKMFGLNSVSQTGYLVKNSYKNLSWIKNASSSDTSVATVSTTGKALDGTYDVHVEQLAKGVSMVSGSEIDVKRNDEGKLIDNEGNIIEDIKFTMNDGQVDENGELINFNIEISKADGITMNDVVKAINSAKTEISDENGKTKEVSLRTKASYDAGIDRFFLQTTNTGADAQLQITADTDSSGEKFIQSLNLKTSYQGHEEPVDFVLDFNYTGQDAIIDFNGASGITSSTNNITINGITMNLVKEGDFTVTVATDVDAIYEKVETFVNDYNELVGKTNKLLGEKRYRDYLPLTDEQKKEMEESDIKLWEEKAKSGLLTNDDIIQRTMQNVRTSIYEKFGDGPFKLITDIGISTEEYSRGNAGGKLEIDEQKLKEAISQDPEAVMDMLFKGSSEEDDEKGGLVTRIHDNLISGMEDIIEKSGTGGNDSLYRDVKSNILIDFVTEYGSKSMIDENVLDHSKRIDDLNDMLIRKENNYYAKFTAMEKAISRMNQQSAWLMQQFGG